MRREVFLASRGLLAESIAPQCIAAGDSANGGLAAFPATAPHDRALPDPLLH
jgi:acetyl esterase/lipase